MKRFKAKKKRKYYLIKILFIIGLIYVSFSYSFKFLYNKKIKDKVSNKVIINYLLKTSANNLIETNKNNDLFNINFNSSSLLLKTSMNHLIDDSAVVFEDSYDEESIVTKYFEDPNKYNVKKPLIYLYNSHQLEDYSNSNVNMYDASPNVLMASYILKEKLNDLNIPTIVEETDITELLNINNWKYSYSYKASRMLVEDALAKNDSLKYIIDIHRDSVPKNTTTLTLNNKSYAKILFVVGIEHENYEQNIAIAQKLSDIVNSKCDSLSKGILKKGGKGNNGIYNQDLSSNALLIEVGGPENTIDEVTNTLTVIANSLYDLVNSQQ